jgi:hypothetical protein
MENVDFDLLGQLVRAVQSDVRGVRERFNGLELRFAGLEARFAAAEGCFSAMEHRLHDVLQDVRARLPSRGERQSKTVLERGSAKQRQQTAKSNGSKTLSH